MSDSVRPHRRKPTRLTCPWDSPGKNSGVGCHFLLQCMKVKSESEIAQSCLTLSDPMDCSLPGSSVYGIFQARVLEWGAIAFSEYYATCHLIIGFLFFIGLSWWLRGKKKEKKCRRCGFSPWVGKIPWRLKQQSTPVFLPGKSHGKRSLAAYSPWGHKRVGHELVTKQQHNNFFII